MLHPYGRCSFAWWDRMLWRLGDHYSRYHFKLYEKSWICNGIGKWIHVGRRTQDSKRYRKRISLRFYYFFLYYFWSPYINEYNQFQVHCLNEKNCNITWLSRTEKWRKPKQRKLYIMNTHFLTLSPPENKMGF